MRSLFVMLWVLLTWPLAVWTAHRARRRLRGYVSERGALTIQRVA
jgi:hypothetical protein